MTIRAGFSQVDITPRELPARTYFGTADRVIDPLSACAAVFSNGEETVAFLSIDVVIVEWEYVQRIRKGVAQRRAIPMEGVLVGATHNHACPAVVERPGFPKDEEYLDFMVDASIRAVVDAFDDLTPGEIGLERGYESRFAFNRRFVRLDGTVVSQPHSMDGVLCREGVTDPGLGLVAFRDLAGAIKGLLVNYSCHACHLMGQLSAGYPGALRSALVPAVGRQAVCVFLNGACGNVIHRDYADPDSNLSKDHCGQVLAQNIEGLLAGLDYRSVGAVRAAEKVVSVGYRDFYGLEEALPVLCDEYNVFPVLVERGWYDHSLAVLRDLHARSDHEDGLVQVVRVGDAYFGSVPAEYFAENALRIKELSPQPYTFVVSVANGWMGYVPHPAAFERRGGHEATWAFWSRMEEGAGHLLGDAVLDLIGQVAA